MGLAECSSIVVVLVLSVLMNPVHVKYCSCHSLYNFIYFPSYIQLKPLSKHLERYLKEAKMDVCKNS